MSVIFTEDDEGIIFLYNDMVVVTLNEKNYDVHHILIDNKSLANILYFDSLVKMGYPPID